MLFKFYRTAIICLLLIDNEEFIVVFGEIIKGKGTF